MFFLLKTKDGYSLDEVVSALQKSIRRGKEEEAFYWAQEMCPLFEGYLWKRLLVISYEDVSALVPGNIPAAISGMREDYLQFRKEGNGAAILVLSNAILLLSRAPKTRIADNFLITMAYRLQNGVRLEIPDYALDKHTRRGREMKRGFSHFVEEGSRLENPYSPIDDPYKEESERGLKQGEKVNAYSWAREEKKRKSEEPLVQEPYE